MPPAPAHGPHLQAGEHDPAKVIDRLHAKTDDYVQELVAFLQIPSVGADPAHRDDVRRAAEWLAARLQRAGMENIQIVETTGHPTVIAEWMHAGSKAPTLLVYGHYDVQPASASEPGWRHPPFSGVVEDGRVWGRGATDDKGQLLVHIQAAEAYLETMGKLPVNLRFVFEGEEEMGSLHFSEVIEKARDRLQADLLLVSDSPMRGEDEPTITTSLRGITYLFVDVHGPREDLHSGTWGGVLRNPAEALTQMLATLKDPKTGRILVPGFYDDVLEPSAEERARIRALQHPDAYFQDATGVPALFGEDGWTNEERIGLRPTLEVNGMWGGYTGAGSKTVIPKSAHAKLSARLVANQDPRRIYDLIREHLDRVKPPGVHVRFTLDNIGDPVRADPSHPLVAVVDGALRATFGRTPALIPEGGSIPAVATMQRQLGVVPVLVGFGQRDENMHAPNESFRLKNYARGREASARIMAGLAGAREG